MTDHANEPDARWVDLEYEIDRDGAIRSVSDDWDTVARDAGAEEVLGAAVLGTSLWDHVSDPTSRHLWELIAKRVETTGRDRVVPIRCDTPGLRRWIEIRVGPSPGDGVRFQTRLVRQVGRSPIRLLASPSPLRAPDREKIRMCGWCKRVHTSGSEWLELEEALGRMTLLARDAPPVITHGICGECEHRLLEQMS